MKAMARVKLTVQFELPDHWEVDCLVNQIFKQAKDSALGTIRNKMPPYVNVVGEPLVTAIFLEE